MAKLKGVSFVTVDGMAICCRPDFAQCVQEFPSEVGDEPLTQIVGQHHAIMVPLTLDEVTTKLGWDVVEEASQ